MLEVCKLQYSDTVFFDLSKAIASKVKTLKEHSQENQNDDA